MMRRSLLMTLACAVVLIALAHGCQDHTTTMADPDQAATASAAGPAPTVAADMAAVVQGSNAFALDLYARLAERDVGAQAPAASHDNLFFSPVSIHGVLTMAYAGARGRTAAQMRDVLRLTLPPERLHAAMVAMQGRWHAPAPGGEQIYELLWANALWVQKDFTLLPDFVACIGTHYGGQAYPVDFGQPANACRKINDWASAHTKGHITGLVKPEGLDPLTRLILTSAIYFRGQWQSPFAKSETGDKAFKLGGERSVMVPQMSQKGFFAYAETDNVQVAELPYRGHTASAAGGAEGAIADDLAMLIVLPRNVEGLAAMEKSLDAYSLTRWTARLKCTNLKITLPRFHFYLEYGLSGVLAAMGMKDAFGEHADFSGMDGRRDLYIQFVVHKALIDVDEEGTVAAAATGGGGALFGIEAPPPPPKIFRADHPFLFLICHRPTGAILFMGRVMNPAE